MRKMDMQLVQENGDHTKKPLAILLHVQEETYLANYNCLGGVRHHATR